MSLLFAIFFIIFQKKKKNTNKIVEKTFGHVFLTSTARKLNKGCFHNKKKENFQIKMECFLPYHNC